MVEEDGSTPLNNYSPKLGPYNSSTYEWEYTPAPAVFTNTIAYKCRQHGIWTRGAHLTVSGSILLDNTNGMLMVPGPVYVENTYIEGETNNIGTPIHYSWLPDMPRSRPVWWTNAMPILGVGCYDAGGPQLYS